MTSRPRTAPLLAASLALAGVLPAAVRAQVILSPTAVVSNTAGNFPGSGYNIVNAINQSGLTVGFASGVTNFDAYMAGNPRHAAIAQNNEWIGAFVPGNPKGDVVFDLGQSYFISRLVLWNQEYDGMVGVRIDTSDDPTFGTFTTVANLAPSVIVADPYPGQVFDLSPSNSRYVRLDDITMSPSANAASMGEIAFAVGPVQPVPEPGLLGVVGVAGLVLWRRSRRK